MRDTITLARGLVVILAISTIDRNNEPIIKIDHLRVQASENLVIAPAEPRFSNNIRQSRN